VEYSRKNEPASHGHDHGSHGGGEKAGKKAPAHGAVFDASKSGGLS
jgi:hypothetical protein